jgi:glycosyltransferase involved in cell wall biosynthesis
VTGLASPGARPSRIARVITRLNVGGPAIQAIDLSRDLAARGFDTCLVHGALGPAEGDMTAMMPVAATETIHLETLRRPLAPLDDLRAWWRLYRLFRRWRPAIVHTHMAKAGALGRLAAIAYRRTTGEDVRLVHTYHGHVFEGYFDSRQTKAILFVERWLGRRTDALVAVSPQIRRDILETYRLARDSRVRVIPLGFNLDRFAGITPPGRRRARQELGLADEAAVITTVGRLTAIKQHALFIEMAARLAETEPRARYLIVGNGELREGLERLAAARGLGERVRFLGWRSDLDRIYAATDVFVLTSRNEGTPVALIEAMAAGVASVSTDVGGVRDVVDDPAVGTLVPVGDPDALADAVGAYLHDPTLRAATGAAARDAVLQRFDLRRLVDDIAGLYRELLARPPA